VQHHYGWRVAGPTTVSGAESDRASDRPSRRAALACSLAAKKKAKAESEDDNRSRANQASPSSDLAALKRGIAIEGQSSTMRSRTRTPTNAAVGGGSLLGGMMGSGGAGSGSRRSGTSIRYSLPYRAPKKKNWTSKDFVRTAGCVLVGLLLMVGVLSSWLQPSSSSPATASIRAEDPKFGSSPSTKKKKRKNRQNLFVPLGSTSSSGGRTVSLLRRAAAASAGGLRQIDDRRRRQQQHHGGGKHRIAMILPFVGTGPESIPSYLNAFCVGAAGASDLVDFILVHNGVLDRYEFVEDDDEDSNNGFDCPSNVKLLSLGSTEKFAEHLVRVVDHKEKKMTDTNEEKNPRGLEDIHNKDAGDSTTKKEELAVSKRRLVTIVAKHIEACPYCLVEFKPALGTYYRSGFLWLKSCVFLRRLHCIRATPSHRYHFSGRFPLPIFSDHYIGYIFEEYLEGYSHWGYSDVDMLFGDLGRWISSSELEDFDIVTYGFGDQHRLYLRGQFTLHKNNNNINQIWRSCEYLSDLDTRLVSVLQGKEKYHFESAEGCYSVAVLRRQDISVKYAVKAWTDIHGEDTADTNGIYIARGKPNSKMGDHNRVVVYKAESSKAGQDVLALSPTWFEKDNVYNDAKQDLQQLFGDRIEIDLPYRSDKKLDKCMYWVQQKYQSSLCLTEDAATATDTLFLIEGKLFKQPHRNIPLQTRGLLTVPFFHFQEWKRYFRPSQLTSLHYSSPTSLFVVVKEGAIPVPTVSGQKSPYSRAIPSPLQLVPSRWKPASEDHRSQLPGRSYCLISGPRKYPPQPPAPECYYQVSWRDEEKVRILSGAPGWTSFRVDLDVTLVLTLQLSKLQGRNPKAFSDIVDIAVENLKRWQGQPSVVVIHVAGVVEGSQTANMLRKRLGPRNNSDLSVENALIAVVPAEGSDNVSRKALLNMGIDAVPTRWYISGLEIERGLVISSDSAYFAHRALLTYDSNSWDVFLLPQFSLKEEDVHGLDVTLSDIESVNEKGEIHPPSDVERACDEDVVVRLDKVEVLWWVMVETMLDSENVAAKKVAEWFEQLQSSLIEFLTDEHHIKMFSLDESPLLMTDNIGPSDWMRTDEVIREVEELGGRRCYNGLRLAQMATLGYRFNVLAGAFALSTHSTRGAFTTGIDDNLPGTSRCEGCFMFGEEYEDILEDIILKEIRRPGKAAVLYAELYNAALHRNQ